jgi:hypothetical protein
MQQPPYFPEAVPGQLTPGPDATEVSSLAAFKDVFEDENWKTNVLLGCVLMLIPIVGPIALSGWMCEVHQRHLRRHPKPVPKIDFGDFMDYIKRGLGVFLSSLVFGFPIYLLIYAIFAAMGFGTVILMRVTGEPWIALAIVAVGGLVGAFVALSMMVVLNAVHTRAELTEDFGQAVKLGEVMAYTKATFGKTLWKSITFSFLGFGVVILGMLMCYIGLYPAIAVLQIAAMHQRRQIYQYYLAKGGPPIPMKDPQPLQSEAQQQPPPGPYAYG